tara:strand:- start:493 stop:798 length:306 start_codon:yes stop_codon:yes gene_type:complete
MATERTNNGVMGIGGVIMALGMVAAIFGIGNHLSQRLEFIKQQVDKAEIRIEAQSVRQRAFELKVAEHRVDNAYAHGYQAAKNEAQDKEIDKLSKEKGLNQ